MKNETKFRAGIAMSLLTCTILMFFLAESQRKLDESQTTLKLTQDTLLNERVIFDSVHIEYTILSHEHGIMEWMVDELSKTTKYKDLKIDLEKERNSNKYE
jgi:hypothetical protein